MNGKPVPKEGHGRVPDGVYDRLGRMAFTDQFAAVRALHAAIRTDGPSPSRLAALSRAYANLGLLTEFQWDAASLAYKARAILYAQRLCDDRAGVSAFVVAPCVTRRGSAGGCG